MSELAQLIHLKHRTLGCVPALDTALSVIEKLLERLAAAEQRNHMLDLTVEQQQISIDRLTQTLLLLEDQHQPTKMKLGGPMGLSIDSVNQKLYLNFEDRDNDVVDAPSGLTVTFTPDNTSVISAITTESATVPWDPNTNTADGPNAKQAYVGDITIAGAGDVNVSVSPVDASGNPPVGPDGTTPIAVPAPLALHVDPGAPASEQLTEA